MLLTITVLAAEEKKAEAEKKADPIGVSFGIDY
jgi:hypothetical protein